MHPVEQVPVAEIRAAAERLGDSIVRTPLIELNVDTETRIFLKLENLQPIGSFKLRGAGNAMRRCDPATLAKGVCTASAGNMAQGVAWNARAMGVPCHVVVPDGAPQTKLDAVERLGGHIIKVPFDDWWQAIVTHEFPGLHAFFIHPVSNPDVMAGNGTIGLEILEDLPNVDSILVPYGGGGLSCGIASAVKTLKPNTKIFACEVDTAAPFAASLEQHRPVEIEQARSFVDGIGGKSVLAEMWPLASRLLDGSLVTTLEEIAAAIRTLIERNRVVAEGAGASTVANAMAGAGGSGNVVCVISGGNIDASKLEIILGGGIP
jgi:threonine dehydratase